MSFDELRALLLVVERGSFLSAATTLGVSRTTLRRQVDALEASAGVPLLHRNAKGVALTEAGRQLVHHGRVMQQELEALLHAVREAGRRPAGEVRFLLPVGLPPSTLSGLYGLVQASWPEVRVRLRFAEAPLATDLSSVDVVVWFGGSEPPGAWETRMVREMRQRLIAAPAYLGARGAPRSLDDLGAHDVLAWLAPGETAPQLVTVEGQALPLRARLASTNVDLLHECAHLGLGIAWAPDGALPATAGREPLVPVLGDLVGRDVTLRLAVPRALAEIPKVRVFLEHLDVIRAHAFGEADAAPAAGVRP